MASSSVENRRNLSFPLAVTVGCAVLLIGLAWFVLSRPLRRSEPAGAAASLEAKGYLSNIALSDVTMQATENFMRQQVVEVQGKIRNNGPRALESVDVYCLFYGTDGREIHREKVPIVHAKGAPFRTGDTREFRLPFDNLPDGWNQAMPKMVIAQIAFAS